MKHILMIMSLLFSLFASNVAHGGELFDKLRSSGDIIVAHKTSGPMPPSVDDTVWAKLSPTIVKIYAKGRVPLNASVRIVYNDKRIAIHIEADLPKGATIKTRALLVKLTSLPNAQINALPYIDLDGSNNAQIEWKISGAGAGDRVSGAFFRPLAGVDQLGVIEMAKPQLIAVSVGLITDGSKYRSSWRFIWTGVGDREAFAKKIYWRPKVKGDARRGRQVMEFTGCGGCHAYPDMPNTDDMMGPSMSHAGGLYRPEFLIEALKHPSAVIINDARYFHLEDGRRVSNMPPSTISGQEIADLVEYLLTLKGASKN